MKKAKIMLSVAGILSVVAGAFAFKAQHKFLGTYYCTSLQQLGTTTVKFNTTYTTSPIGSTLFCTKIATSQATTTYKVAVNS